MNDQTSEVLKTSEVLAGLLATLGTSMPTSFAPDRSLRRRFAGLALLICSLVLGYAGCSRGPSSAPKREVQVVEQRDDSLQLALELFQQSREPGQIRSALNHVSNALAKVAAKTASHDEAARKRLQELFRLDKAEMEDLDSLAVRPLDAPYLESCFQFRDSAR